MPAVTFDVVPVLVIALVYDKFDGIIDDVVIPPVTCDDGPVVRGCSNSAKIRLSCRRSPKFSCVCYLFSRNLRVADTTFFISFLINNNDFDGPMKKKAKRKFRLMIKIVWWINVRLGWILAHRNEAWENRELVHKLVGISIENMRRMQAALVIVLFEFGKPIGWF